MSARTAIVPMLAIVATLAAAALAVPVPTGAQTLPGCEARAAGDPPRTVVDCDGTLLEWETASALGIVPRDGGGTVLLDEGAALVEAARGGPDFQIRTPHAIASVRGTVFAVEVTTGGTAVFVAEGRVWVRQIGSTDDAVLSAGDGVDVAPGEPLVVRRWGTARADALLGRFGR